ncbi:MAG: pullulanase-type alpha-1,6-glucosidase [Chloroflexi bacterium]|nr:pullulanase-type alpha-1,6-glucosidase [Chloroflexota bacterium]
MSLKFLFILPILFVVVIVTSMSVTAQEDQPTMVVIPGTIQSALGCPGDWQPDCAVTALTYSDKDQLWEATFDLPAGSYEYKVALNGTWDVNYGLNAEAGGKNIPLVLDKDTSVKFIYSNETHWVTDSINSLIANVPGSYQSEIGCPDDWQPDCLRSLLQDPDGDGIYTYTTTAIPAGDYEAKVAVNGTWDVNYGEDGAPGGANIAFNIPTDKTQAVFSFDSSTHMMTITAGDAAPQIGNLKQAQAQWVTRNTIAWRVSGDSGTLYRLFYSSTAGLKLTEKGVIGYDGFLKLSLDTNGLSASSVLSKFPQLAGYSALTVNLADIGKLPTILRDQIAVAAFDSKGTLLDATAMQIPGVLDDLYRYEGDLGVTFADGVPRIRVWAPTAQNVRLHLFDDSSPATEPTVADMSEDGTTGVWSIRGAKDWYGKYYLFEVTVYAPSTGNMVVNLVTDPYSVSLSTNSERSQIIDLNDPALMPDAWQTVAKPPLAAPEDSVIYELHVRDFSAYDESVSPENRGKFTAFTETASNGMQHLQAMAEAGLTHVHLLPVFDIATINENADERHEPDRAALEALPRDSDQQQVLVGQTKDVDSYNWGYDPLHYTVPEGSYSTNPDGTQRILEFREMVQALNQTGLRVVMDVVYNHTTASGEDANSVLDRIVPGYYQRLDDKGRVENSTCCSNTATEHFMMEKLMLDSLRTWATQYKVDGFRFDLMGHHMLSNMNDVTAMLHSLTPNKDGVDGSAIYVYGEGWDFGEVANNARGINATQLNIGGSGIGVFNDRVRDSIRGGNPFGDLQKQGFIDGLYYDPNELETRSADEQKQELNLFADRIRVNLTGNLRDYTFENANGEIVKGSQIDYNGSPTGYTLDPQENISYASAHDNETLFDVIQAKAPASATIADRARMQQMGLSLVMLSQGVPFFQAGDELLRSKSGDKNSYNSGDWFNALDFTYKTDGWGRGLALAGDNQSNWPIWQPLLANPALMPTQQIITDTSAYFEDMLRIRKSSPLFRLQTADQVAQVLSFANTGVDQVPGLIVMVLDDPVAEGLDSEYSQIVVLFNANTQAQSFTLDAAKGLPFYLHPIQANGSDPTVKRSSFDESSGAFTVPARTTAVFVLNDPIVN